MIISTDNPINNDVQLILGVSSQIKINSRNVESLNITDRETMAKVCHFVINHLNRLTGDEEASLIALKYRLDAQIQSIKNDTTGIIAFFRYFFCPEEKAEKKRQVEYFETLSDFILDVRNSWLGFSPLPGGAMRSQNESDIELFDFESDYEEFSDEYVKGFFEVIENNGSSQRSQAQKSKTPISVTTDNSKLASLTKEISKHPLFSKTVEDMPEAPLPGEIAAIPLPPPSNMPAPPPPQVEKEYLCLQR